MPVLEAPIGIEVSAMERSAIRAISLPEMAKLPRSAVVHQMTLSAIRPSRLEGPKALEIIKSRPGGIEAISRLQAAGKLATLPAVLGQVVGYSDATSGDPWYSSNAEISGPNVNRITFCCMDGPNGHWSSSFTMPAKDHLLAMVHVQDGSGTVTAKMDGISLGSYAFSGNDWIVVLVNDLDAGFHTFEIAQETGYFSWVSTEYIRL